MDEEEKSRYNSAFTKYSETPAYDIIQRNSADIRSWVKDKYKQQKTIDYNTISEQQQQIFNKIIDSSESYTKFFDKYNFPPEKVNYNQFNSALNELSSSIDDLYRVEKTAGDRTQRLEKVEAAFATAAGAVQNLGISPEQIKDIQTTLEKFKGHERALWDAIWASTRADPAAAELEFHKPVKDVDHSAVDRFDEETERELWNIAWSGTDHDHEELAKLDLPTLRERTIAAFPGLKTMQDTLIDNKLFNTIQTLSLGDQEKFIEQLQDLEPKLKKIAAEYPKDFPHLKDLNENMQLGISFFQKYKYEIGVASAVIIPILTIVSLYIGMYYGFVNPSIPLPGNDDPRPLPKPEEHNPREDDPIGQYPEGRNPKGSNPTGDNPGGDNPNPAAPKSALGVVS